MKSFCIKTNNAEIIRYLIEEFSKYKKNDFIVKFKSFKLYDNIILHFLSSNIDVFYSIISNVLSDTILKFYEPVELKRELKRNFFYFTEYEKERIVELCLAENTSNSTLYLDKFNYLFISFYNYISNHHSIVLTGFYNFRLGKYHNILNEILDISVGDYLIEREYLEFINLLKLYINSNPFKSNLIHLIYSNQEFIVLDENKNIINPENKNILNAKFLSDISFSGNDYVLNYLLNELPRKIIIHVPPTFSFKDDFYNTLKLIFDDRIIISSKRPQI